MSKVAQPGFLRSAQPYLGRADVFIIASDEQGFCQALAEVMREGLLVISTDAQGGGPDFVLDHGNAGVLVPMDDVDALSAAMLAMTDPDVREKYAEPGRQRALDFTPEAVSDKLLHFVWHVGASI